jgi:hypothetical protein
VPKPTTEKKRSLDEIVKDNAAVWLLGTAVACATAGFTASPALLRIAGRTTVDDTRLTQLEQIDKDHKELNKEINVLSDDLKKATSGSNRLAELVETGWAYREVNLRVEKGASFDIGRCAGDQCYRFEIKDISQADNAAPEVNFSVIGFGNGDCSCSHLSLPLIKGKKLA